MDRIAIIADSLIGKPENTSLEGRIFTAILLIGAALGILKTISNAFVLNFTEVVIAMLVAITSGLCYGYVRKSGNWYRLAMPVALIVLAVITYDWIIDPAGIVSNDGDYFIILAVIAPMIFRKRQQLPFLGLLCGIVLCFCLKSLAVPFRGQLTEKAQASIIIDTGITLVMTMLTVAILVGIVINEYRRVLEDVRKSHEEIKILRGYLPICASCKKIRDDDTGDWKPLETYICNNSEANFTHTYCPECREKSVKDFLVFKNASADIPGK